MRALRSQSQRTQGGTETCRAFEHDQYDMSFKDKIQMSRSKQSLLGGSPMKVVVQTLAGGVWV